MIHDSLALNMPVFNMTVLNMTVLNIALSNNACNYLKNKVKAPLQKMLQYNAELQIIFHITIFFSELF